jgi:hypothetical protein
MGLILFPFKAWVLVALPLLRIFQSYAAHQHVRGLSEASEAVLGGYLLSIIALLLGAVIQAIFFGYRTAVTTVLYAIGSMVVVLIFYRF